MMRGPRCTDLERRRDAKFEEIAPLRRDKDLTDRATTIEAELFKAKQDRDSEGAPPEHLDAETERFVGFLALLGIVSNDQAKAFSEHKPVIDAITMEMMAFVGTPSLIAGIFILFATMVKHRPPAPTVDPHSPEAVLEIAEPGKKRRTRKKKEASPDSVRQWFKERVIGRDGRKIQSKIARADYVQWCFDKGLEPVSAKVFGVVLRDELGIQKDRKSGRVEYLNIGIRPANLRVVG
jgi:hypothetical protein